MNPVLRNILALVVGWLVGAAVNMGVIELGMNVIPPPEGTDTTTIEGVKEAMKSFTPKNFVTPLVAHALGTLVGAFVAAKLAASHHMKFALGVGGLFLLGGLAMAFMVGGPAWFLAADLLLAYIPMGYLGGILAGAKR